MPTDILLIKAPILDNVDHNDCYDDYQYVEKYFPEMFPVVGEILVGEVKSEKEYGYFITIAQFDSPIAWSEATALGYRERTLDGLLHRSNLNKNSPWSLANKHILIDDYTPLERKVLVKVIDISSKGYSLKELDYGKNISAESILKSDDLDVISMSTSRQKEKDDSGCYNKVIIDTEMLQVSKKLGAFIFKGLIYTKMYHSCEYTFALDCGIYCTSDLKNIMYSDRNQLCNYDDYDERKSDKTHSKIWELDEEISNFNQENDRLYEIHLQETLERKRLDSLFSSFDKMEPTSKISMYLSSVYRSRLKGHRESDSHWAHRYFDNEITTVVEIYENITSGETYIKFNNKYYLLGEPGTIRQPRVKVERGVQWEYGINFKNNEVFTIGSGRRSQDIDVYFKVGIHSDVLRDKYRNDKDIRYFSSQIINDDLQQGEKR